MRMKLSAGPVSKSVLAATAVVLVSACASAQNRDGASAQNKDGASAQNQGETVSQTTTPAAPSGGAQGFVKPSAPTPVDSYIVDLAPAVYKSAKNKEMKVEAQFLFLNQETAKKAFANKEELQQVLTEVFKTTKTDFKTPVGKIALKGEVLAKLFEKGYEAEGVLWNGIRF
jgi:hypothetical protein